MQTEISPIEIKKTDTLEMEYVLLPIVDLSFRFLYRFNAPVPTIWQEGAVSILKRAVKVKEDGSGIDQFAYHQPAVEAIGDYGLMAWKAMVKGEGTLPEEGKWLEEVSKVVVAECHIVRK